MIAASKELREIINGPDPEDDLVVPVRKGHAKSTLDATVWLMAFHPEKLAAWLARHEEGLELAAIEHRKQHLQEIDDRT
jgi:hypothetical protein